MSFKVIELFKQIQLIFNVIKLCNTIKNKNFDIMSW